MQIRTPEERELLIDAIKKDLAGALAKYQDSDASREIVFAIAETVRCIDPCPDIRDWSRFVDGAFYSAAR